MNLPFLDVNLKKWNGGILRGAPRRFAKKIRVEEATVSRWRRGGAIDPDLRDRVAAEFGITVQQLTSGIEASKNLSSRGVFEVRDTGRDSGYQFVEIPHLGVVSASRFTFSFDLPPENFTPLAVRSKAGDRFAMLRISGDCMAPRIEDGDEVLIRQTSEVTDGTIAIVCFDGECTMKRVYKTKDGVELRADNPTYKPVRYKSNKVRILAEVVKIIKDPRRKP